MLLNYQYRLYPETNQKLELNYWLRTCQYQNIEPTPEGRFWSQQLKLYLGIHEGKLRFFTDENELVPSGEELAEQESLRAQLAEERAQLAEERVKLTEREILRLRELLRAHGIEDS